MRSEAIEKSSLYVLLRAMYPKNRLALITALYTGLRIDDVLSIKTSDVQRGRFSVQERKTGKRKAVNLPEFLQSHLLDISGSIYVWAHRYSGKRHRTRQAVYKDLKRVARLFKVNGNGNGVSPHSVRKTYARDLREQGFSTAKIQRALNHSDPTITALYMYADELALK